MSYANELEGLVCGKWQRWVGIMPKEVIMGLVERVIEEPKQMRWIIILLVVFTIGQGTVGCDRQEAGPRRVMLDVHRAYQAGDTNAFLKLYHTDTADEVKLIRAQYRLALAWKLTGEKVDEVYGKGKWGDSYIKEVRQADKDAGVKGAYKYLDFPGLSRVWTSNLKVKMAGENQAVVYRETHEQGLPMVKVDGQWYVDGRLGEAGKAEGYIDTWIVTCQVFGDQLGWLREQAERAGMTWKMFQRQIGEVPGRVERGVMLRAEAED